MSPASVGGLLTDDPEIAVRAVLLIGVLLLLRRSGIPRGATSGVSALLVAAAIAGPLRGYAEVNRLDDLAHFSVTGSLALVSTVVLRRRLEASTESDAFRLSATAGVGVTVVLGLAIAASWELYEWIVITYFRDHTIWTTYDDTMSDIAFGTLGAGVSGGVSALVRGRVGLAIPRARHLRGLSDLSAR